MAGSTNSNRSKVAGGATESGSQLPRSMPVNARADIAHRGAVDQFGFAQDSRARQHRAGDVGYVAGERQHDMMRGLAGAGQGFGQRAAHQRRMIVEQRGQADARLAAQRGRQIGIEIGARQRARGFRPPAGVRPLRPDQKAAHDGGIIGRRRFAPRADVVLAYGWLQRGPRIILVSEPDILW